jgi:predicted HD phosphohydrolase
VRLRTWDDGGKVEGLEVPDLDHYRPLLDRLAESR